MSDNNPTGIDQDTLQAVGIVYDHLQGEQRKLLLKLIQELEQKRFAEAFSSPNVRQLARNLKEASYDHDEACSTAVSRLIFWIDDEQRTYPVHTVEHVREAALKVRNTAEALHQAHDKWFAAWKAEHPDLEKSSAVTKPSKRTSRPAKKTS